MNAKQSELISVVDGGDTQSLTEEVLNTTYSDAIETYYELMARSPNVSEEVLIEAVKQFELPNVLLTLILASNPTAAKSTNVRGEVQNRLIPLEEYQLELIEEGRYWVSYKEQLEGRISQLKGWLDYILIQQIDGVLLNEDGALAVAEVEELLSDQTEPRWLYLRAAAMSETGNLAGAIELLETMPAYTNLHALEQEQLDDALYVYSLLELAGSNQLTALNTSQQENLEAIAAKEFATSTQLARGLLLRFGILVEVGDNLFIPQPANRSLRYKDGNKSAIKFELFPNPAQSFISIRNRDLLSSIAEVEMQPTRSVSNSHGSKIRRFRCLIFRYYPLVFTNYQSSIKLANHLYHRSLFRNDVAFSDSYCFRLRDLPCFNGATGNFQFCDSATG